MNSKNKKRKLEDCNVDFIKPEWFQIPNHLLVDSPLQKLKRRMGNRDNDANQSKKSYSESRKEAADLRKHILNFVKCDELVKDSSIIPNDPECNLIRYYYYIHQGVDISNIAPLDKSCLDNILRGAPGRTRCRKETINELINEINEDFYFAIKKSVIDFTLQDYDSKNIPSMPEPKRSLNEINARKEYFNKIKRKIGKNLFIIHPTVVKIGYLWYLQYRNLRIINIAELYESDALDLNQFKDWLSSQIKMCKGIVDEKWIPSVFKIVVNATKKKLMANIPSKKLPKFYETLSTLMTLQFQTLCLQTIYEYTEFICDVKRSPGFQVHVLYKNNKIIFNPTFGEFRDTMLNVYSDMIRAVSDIPRIETKLFEKNIDKYDSLFLKPSILPTVVEECRMQVDETLKNEWICPELKIQDFDEYVCLINGQSRIEVNKFLSDEQPFRLFKLKVAYYHNLSDEIALSSSRVVTIGTFEIHREHFISILMNKSQVTKDRFLTKISDTYQNACRCLNEEFQIIKDTLLKPPANTAELVQMKEYCLNLGTDVFFQMENRLRETMNYILFCSDYVPLTSAQIKQNSVTFLWYRRINSILEENRGIIKEKTKEFQDFLVNRIENFKRSLEKYEMEVAEFQNYRDAGDLSKYLKKSQNLHKKLCMANDRIREFNEEEVAFGWIRTVYPKREEIVNKLAPYKKLYENCADYKNKYQIWTEAKVGTFQPNDIEKDVETFHDNIIELSKQFSSMPAPYALTNSIRQEVEQFQGYMPIVNTLGNPCLKERHWEKISEIVGFPIRVEDDLTLAKILDYGLDEYVPKFQVISDSATKENNLEMRLNQMITEWKDMKFKITPYRDSGTFTLTTADEIQVLLDDHIVKTQTMKNSPYIKPFESTIHSWEQKLILLQEIIDAWFLVQKMWLYLEPIFTFSDIQQQMPEESKRFGAIDKIWKDIMKAASANTTVLVVIGIDKMLERLAKCNALLNLIQKGLGNYLDTKRLNFPRFFFLSNEEILDIISNTRDPAGVQPYLKKCFQGIRKFRFNDDSDILSIISDLGEELTFHEVVNTSSRRGNVEKWLADVEVVMKESIKEEISKAVQSYDKINYDEWIKSSIQQIICLVVNIVHTRTVEKILENAKDQENYFAKCISMVEKISERLKMKMEAKQRLLLECLFVYNIQIRDSVKSLIDQINVDEIIAEYNMQMHHHFQEDQVTLRMANSTIEYGNEYIGDFSPMIRTPMTDRCLRSFFIAFKYNLGAYLEASVGLGKSTMIKDFAKLAAKHYVIFGCFKQLDYSVVEKFFKGIVASDSWFCFDNLHMVNEEGLQVIDHFVVAIQRCVFFKEECVRFNGTKFDHCSGMIYATVCSDSYSRKKLPACIRTYFRRVCFNDTEFREIIEMELALMGFRECNVLAEKVSGILALCGDLFKDQNYFHFDLRLVRNILENAKNLKTKHFKMDEKVILGQAIRFVTSSILRPKDVILLETILKNVFQSEIPHYAIDELEELTEKVCQSNNLVFNSDMRKKIELFYTAMNFNSGLMLVGDAFTGKTTLLNVLSQIRSKKENGAGLEIEKVVINPQSVTLQQLYGHQDQTTSEWVDGILSAHYRKFNKSENSNRKWLIFDGPCDPSWMEQLHSVLDGMKKLCLKSGETLQLRNDMNLIFETNNLHHVSPAMVSRCCIIFTDENTVRWQNLICSWVKTFPKFLNSLKDHVEKLSLRFCTVLFSFLDSVRDNLIYPVTKNMMIKSLCDIFDCFIDDFNDENYTQNISEIDTRSQLEGVFFFSCIWSLGALLNKADKEKFDVLFRALQQKEFPNEVRERFNLSEQMCGPAAKQYVYIIPDFGTVFDYQYIKEGKGKWKLWSESVTLTSAIPRDVQFHQIIVPTKATIRNHSLISMLIQHQKSVMFVGDAATGKTVDIKHYLNNKLDKSIFKPIFLNFSSGTTGNVIQRLINHHLDKRKKGVYGPPLGMRYVLFVDDVNTSAPNKYGVFSSIELLRHYIEYNQWYNTETATPVQLVDLQLICSFTTKHDGESYPSYARFCRHFNFISNDLFDDETLKSIFSKIMLWHLDTRGFSKEFDPCIDQIVDATLAIHRMVQRNLLPLPNKSHYIFNLRAFSRIVQGVVLSVPEAIEDLSAMKRLWVHEVMRIYHDKIIDSEDSNWFMNSLKSVTEDQLKENANHLLSHLLQDDESEVNQLVLRRLIFCDFINPKADVRNYAEVQDMEGLQSIVEGYLVEHNNVNKKPMNLILFPYAIEHISRICRILKQPQGHALLLGNCGLGKQSLARLAIHMCEYEFFEVELTSRYNELDWRKDMKSLLCSVYTDQHSAFLLNNIQVMPESMLEDVSNLLQTGEIPEIFTPDDMKEIYEKMEIIDNQRDKSLQTDGSHEALYNLFHQRVCKQIHIVLVFNASIYELRKYIHKFPPFNNCCTIDWFQPWPENALKIVSQKLLSDVKLDTTDFKTITKLCEKLHNSAKDVAQEADEMLNVKLYFTQKSYIKLVATFKHLLMRKQMDLQNKRRLLEKSLQRLSSIREQIPFLERECETLQPTIHDKKIQVERLENEVEAEKEVETEAEISTNGAKTTLKNCEKKLNSRKQEFEEQVGQVQAVWETVCENLQSLSSTDITLLKTMKNPPKPLKTVVEALAHIKEIKAEKIQESGKISEDFWRPTVKFIGDTKFIDTMVNFDKSEVSTRNIRIFEEKILSNEDFDGDKIRSCSIAAEAIYKWIMVVYEYNQVTKMDSDVKLNLNEAEEEYATAESNFKSKEKHLEDVHKKRANLIETLEKEKTELDSLEKKENICFKKKLRAEEFVKILLRKKPQWVEKKVIVDETFDTLIGDVLLCATSLTYLTALPCQFRNTKVKAWYSTITDAGIRCRDDFKLWNILMDEIDVLNEHVAGLPEGDFYRENLAMIRCSGRYSILIDPHLVMTKWIKSSKNNLVVIQPTCIDYLQRLETAIASDHPVLLENIGEYLDTILYPLLEKRYFKAPSGMFIKLGEASIEYKPDLELYLSTFLENPHFTAEIYDKVTIINCTMPKSALENMLLKQIMTRDRADLYLEQNQITIQLLDLKKAANEAEIKILSVLSSDHDILEEDNELNVVTMSSMVIDDNSKKISEIESRLEAIQSTEKEYDSNTKQFSNLFQISMSLRNLCNIYQFSLDWFGNLIGSTVERIEKTGKPEQRCETISELVSRNFFSVTSVALEEMDKLIFAFIIAANSMLIKGILNESHMETFYGMLKSSQPLELVKNTDFFKTVAEAFEQNQYQWVETIKKDCFLEIWTHLNSFQEMLLALSLCPLHTVRIITKFVERELGKEYSDFGSFDLNTIFKDSNCGIPIAIVLFDDSEPLKCIFNFAVHMGVSPEKCHILTLTKTLNSIESNLEQCMSSGNWLIIRNLQNCPNWLHDVEKICEDLPSGSAHPDFRLWVILQYDTFCPTKILAKSQLVAYGASKYVNIESFKKELVIRLKLVENESTALNSDLVPNLIAFHEVLRETPNISPWNGYYEFTDTDLLIACREVTVFVNNYKNFPSHGLVKFMLQCCYGNQIVDRWDSEYANTLIRSFWKLEIITSVKTVLIANNKAFDYDPTSISTTSEEISFNKDNWIGSSDYLKVSQTPYYIDKTVYIRSVLADSQYVEFGAPRRFTKSTFLSMLENFVSLNITKNGEKIDKPLESASFKSFRNRAVFHDKQGNPLSDEEIEKDDLFRLYFQNYPVIFADFSSICGTTYHRILHTLHCAIVEAFERHNYILNNDTLWFGKYEKEVFLKNYFTRRKDKDVESISECTLTEAFLHLSRKLYQHFGKKVIVLIDDVDAPTTSALHSESFSHQDVENIILIMNSLLTTICKTVYSDQYIEKVLVTSILSSNAVSCQTNFKRYHFLQNKRYEFLFGFTREEVQARIEDNMQSLKTKIETYDENDFPNTMAAWYNGYRSFSNVSIYNPWAVVNVLTKVIFHGSWAVPATVKNFVRLCIHPTILPTIWRLLNQEYVEMKMTRKYINTFEIPMLLKLRKILLERSVWEPSPFFEYLCESGLLFCKPLKYDKMAMKIPNYGIHSSMESLIFSYGDANTVNFIPPELAKNIAERFTALINSNPDELITNLANDLSVLHRTMHATLNEDVKEMGEYYGVDCVEHNFKWALYVILNHHFPEIENGVQRVIKEEPVPGGRIDLVLMTDHFTFIIELKHGSNSQKTLNQCIKNNYSSIMSELPYSDHERAYMLLGINFQKNKEMKVDISYLSNPTDVKSIRTMTST